MGIKIGFPSRQAAREFAKTAKKATRVKDSAHKPYNGFRWIVII